MTFSEWLAVPGNFMGDEDDLGLVEIGWNAAQAECQAEIEELKKEIEILDMVQVIEEGEDGQIVKLVKRWRGNDIQ